MKVSLIPYLKSSTPPKGQPVFAENVKSRKQKTKHLLGFLESSILMTTVTLPTGFPN